MKNKTLMVLLFVLFGLPIPIALLGGALTFLWFISSLLLEHPFLGAVLSFLGVLLGFGYPVTYGICLYKTIKQKKISIKTFFPLFHCVIALIYLICLMNVPTESVTNPVISSLPRYEDSDCYYGEGFQDYTNYCKYYFKNDNIADKLEKNKYFEKVSVSDTGAIKSYFEDFEKWVEYEDYKDKYDFSTDCIDIEDYFYVENKETCEKYKDYPDIYSAYNVYFFDIQTQTLYYIHSNI